MAKQNKITRDRLAEANVFTIGEDYAKSLEPGIKANKRWLDSFTALKKTAKEYNDIRKEFKKVDNRSSFIKAKEKEKNLSEQVTVALKEQRAAELNLIKTKTKLVQSTESTNRALIKERTALQASNQVIKQQAREQLGLVGAYDKLNKRRTIAQKRLADLLSADKRNISSIKRAQRQYAILNKRILAVDKSTNIYTKNIGNYRSAITGLAGSFRSLVSALGLATGVFAFIRVMSNGIKVIRQYEKANATLSGILQVEKRDMGALRQESQRLGAETVKTANEVVGLQIAYARLGFTQKEIIDLTEATILGSIALNAELDKTAKLTGAMVNTFDEFTTTDVPEIMDVLALATARTALDFEKLEKGLPIVSGAANAAGISFTKLVALMGKLADSGIDVSTSATAIRNIFIISASKGLDYNQTLELIKNSQNKLTASNDEFGRRAAVSASVLANNIEKIEELDVALQGAAGTAESMANKELDTLDGALQLIKSAWQGIILETDDANSISTKLKETLQFLAKNLKAIISFLITGAKAWIAYRIVIKLARVQQSLMNVSLFNSRRAAIASARGINRATLAWLRFSKVIKANLLGIAVAAVTGLIILFSKLNKSIFETADAMHESNIKFQEQAIETQLLNDDLNDMADRYDELTNKTELNKDEQEELDRIIKLLAKHIPDAVTEIDKYGVALGINTDAVKAFVGETATLNKQIAEQKIEEQNDLLDRLEKRQIQVNNALKEGNAIRIEGVGFIRKEKDAFIELNRIQGKNQDTFIDGAKLTSEQTETVREYIATLNSAIKTAKEDIENNEDILTSITGIKNARQLYSDSIESQTNANAKAVIEAEKEIRSVTNLRDRIKDLRKEQLGLTILDKERSKTIAQNIIDYRKEIDAILGVVTADKSAAAEKQKIAKQRQAAFNLSKFVISETIKGFDEVATNEKLHFDEREIALQDKAIEELKLAELIRDFHLSNDKLTADGRLLILKQFDAQKRAIQTGQEEGEDTLTVDRIKENIAKKAAIKEKALADELQLENDFFKAELNLANDKEKAIREHEERVAAIKVKFAKEALEVQIKALEQLVLQSEVGSLARIEAEKKLAQARLVLSDITTEGIIKNDENEVLSTQEKIIQILDISGELAFALTNLSNSILNAKIDNIDREIQASDDFYDKAIEAAGEDDEQKKALEIEKEKRRQELEKKKRVEQRKQAILNKAMAVVDAGINIAVAITQALPNVFLVALTSVLGAIQLAAIVAAPIPQFVEGTDFHKGGLARVGEEQPEVIIEPNRKPYIVSGDQILDLPRGTQVIPSLQEYKDILRASVLSSLNSQNRNINGYNSMASFDAYSDDVVRELRLTREVIKQNKPQQHEVIDIPHQVWKANNISWD